MSAFFVAALRSRRRACVIPVHFLLLAAPLAAANLALQISNETAPAGGWAQIKVTAASPQPVTNGRILMNFDRAVFGTPAQVAVFSANGDANGVAAVSGQSLDITFTSRTGGIGQLPHLPVFTVTVPILASAPAGSVNPITLDPSRIIWGDAQYNSLAVTVSPGSVTVGGSLSVRDLIPGGTLQTAGTLVRVRGAGFTSGTTVSIDGVAVATSQFIGAGEIDLTLAGAADLTGKRVLVRNPDGSQTEFFSSSASVPETAPTRFANLQPVLSMQSWKSAMVGFTIRGGGIALENPNSVPVDVVLQPQSPFSPEDLQSTVTVQPGALVIYSDPDTSVTGYIAIASLPIRILGLGFPPPNGGVFPAVPSPTPVPVQQLAADPATVSFSWQAGSSAPAPVTVRLQNASPIYSPITFQVTAPAAPFSVTPLQGSGLATALTVSVNTAGLNPGTYTSAITVTPEGPNAIPTTIPLFLTVTTPALLVTNFSKISFSGPGQQSLQFLIQSNGRPIAFTATASDGSTPHWLTVTPSAASTPADLIVKADSTNLAEGDYLGQIVIAGPDNTLTIPVHFNVSNANIFGFSPASVTFTVQAGVAVPPPQTVLVYGPSSGAAFTASTNSGGSWLTAAKTASGQLGAVISANPANLKSGTYTGVVTMTSPYSPFPSTIPVTLVVWDQEPVLTASPSNVVFTIPFDGTIAQQAAQTLHVASGGVPLNFAISGMPGAFVTPADIAIHPSGSSGLGVFETDLIVTGGSQKLVVPVTTVFTASPLAPPLIASVVNGASLLPGSVSPGEAVSIFGFGAGPSNPAGFMLDPQGSVATSLNGAQVLFDGHPVPMIYGSASQANVIVPYEVDGRASTTITLQSAGLTSAAWTIPVAGAAPGIFTRAATGVGGAAVLNQDSSVNAPANPAARGSVVQIFATGEGQTSPAGVTGSINGTVPKTPLVTPVKVTIGGQDAVVQYAGSAPNAVAGLLQVNAVVPQSVTPGDAIPVRVSIGGFASQDGVTIAVR
jgi:uncharacterized protein (TIGR03437 family)